MARRKVEVSCCTWITFTTNYICFTTTYSIDIARSIIWPLCITSTSWNLIFKCWNSWIDTIWVCMWISNFTLACRKVEISSRTWITFATNDISFATAYTTSIARITIWSFCITITSWNLKNEFTKVSNIIIRQ